MRFGNEYFLGFLLITAGAVLILRHFFHFNVPVIRTILALTLIYLGITLLWGGWRVTDANMMLFNNGRIVMSEGNPEYNLIFSNGVVELPEALNKQAVSERKKVNVIFSSGDLRIDPSLPVVVNVDSAFARSQFPDGTTLNFGSHTYRSKSYVEGENYLFMEVSVVFGNLRVVQG